MTPKAHRWGRLARTLSSVLHPFVVTVCTVPLVVLFAESDVRSAVLWTVVFFGSVIAPVLSLLLYKVRKLQVDSVDVPIRQQRTLFYAVGIGGFLVLLLLMIWLDAPRVLRASVIAAIVTNVVAVSINHYLTKISVHAAAIAGCTAVLVVIAPWSVSALMLVLTLLQGWSRVYLTRHTVGQVVLGWGVAAASVASVFAILG